MQMLKAKLVHGVLYCSRAGPHRYVSYVSLVINCVFALLSVVGFRLSSYVGMFLWYFKYSVYLMLVCSYGTLNTQYLLCWYVPMVL